MTGWVRRTIKGDDWLNLIRAGLTNEQIAAHFGCTMRTLERRRHEDPGLAAAIVQLRRELATEAVVPECGTVAAYRRHLRRREPTDDACRAANTRQHNEMIERRRGKPIPPHVPHGRASTYQSWHCRCRPCTDAHTAYCAPYARAYVARRRQEVGLPALVTKPREITPPARETRYVPTDDERIEQAFASGRPISWVMNAFGVDYEQAKTIRDALLDGAA